MSSAVIAPPYLWDWYIDYLWNYDHNSWVATIAYGFRVWAILAILPTVILCLLDVTSYAHPSPISISPDTALATPPSPSPGGPTSAAGAIADKPTATTATATYFVGGEGDDDDDDDGAGATRRRRRLLARRDFPREEGDRIVPSSPEHGHERTMSGDSGAYGGAESTSGESSFTLLERAESFEDPAAAHIRRRVPGPAGAADD
ncbi:hypothetical protein EDB92DRAFT_1943185 [Lactarius akahatsu]|uniref:Uncharacterized protein n=1 Tax=Lactarius akahatsu TaxID=416441 RepID=A0AAD4QFJ1_9AGAM|nr:hypothetical protein EDB92DRAFT_1943185 [Lactarius akahatsu]